MILLHHPEVALSRAMLAEMPAGCTVIDWATDQRTDYVGPDPSAFPSVLVDVPAYVEQRQVLDADYNMVGMETVTVDAHQELLRCPASWDAVQQFASFAQARAGLA